MESQSHSFIAGLFVILLGLGGIAGALWLGPDKGPARLPIDLLSTHSVTGLKVDAPVRFRGVDVGRVDSISFDPRQAGEIRVRISVDPAAPISRSTYAKLSYQGITGVAFIQLDDEKGKSSEPLPLSREKVAQMELQASMLERAETDIRDVLLKAARVADRLDELLNEQNQKRVMAMVDSFEQTSERYGELARNLEPSAKALPGLLQQTTRTVEKAQSAVDNVAKLADGHRPQAGRAGHGGRGRQADRASGGRPAQGHPAARERTDRPGFHRCTRTQTNAAPGQRAAAELDLRLAAAATRTRGARVRRNQRSRQMRLLAAVIVLFACSGCSLMGSKEPPKADFDFGPLPAASGARYASNYSGASIVVYEIAAPAWIDQLLDVLPAGLSERRQPHAVRAEPMGDVAGRVVDAATEIQPGRFQPWAKIRSVASDDPASLCPAFRARSSSSRCSINPIAAAACFGCGLPWKAGACGRSGLLSSKSQPPQRTRQAV